MAVSKSLEHTTCNAIGGQLLSDFFLGNSVENFMAKTLRAVPFLGRKAIGKQGYLHDTRWDGIALSF